MTRYDGDLEAWVVLCVLAIVLVADACIGLMFYLIVRLCH